MSDSTTPAGAGQDGEPAGGEDEYSAFDTGTQEGDVDHDATGAERNYLAGTPIPSNSEEAGDAQTTIRDGAERLQEYGEDVSSSPEQRATQDDAKESLKAATEHAD